MKHVVHLWDNEWTDLRFEPVSWDQPAGLSALRKWNHPLYIARTPMWPCMAWSERRSEMRYSWMEVEDPLDIDKIRQLVVTSDLFTLSPLEESNNGRWSTIHFIVGKIISLCSIKLVVVIFLMQVPLIVHSRQKNQTPPQLQRPQRYCQQCGNHCWEEASWGSSTDSEFTIEQIHSPVGSSECLHSPLSPNAFYVMRTITINRGRN